MITLEQHWLVSLYLMTDLRNFGLHSGRSKFGLVVLSPKSKALVGGFEESCNAESLLTPLDGLLMLFGKRES